MKIRAQIAMVLNLDKCIGCHTCSVTCKNVWTSRLGMEYAWFNNVETKPGIGYPKDWENQERWKGGWERKSSGRIVPKQGGELGAPDEDLRQSAPAARSTTTTSRSPSTTSTCRPRPRCRRRRSRVRCSLITGQRMEKIEWGPNWEEILGGEFSKRSQDANFERHPEGHLRPVREHLHDVPAAPVRALPESDLRRVLSLGLDLQARGGRHRPDRPGQVPRLAHVRVGLPLQEDLLQLVHRARPRSASSATRASRPASRRCAPRPAWGASATSACCSTTPTASRSGVAWRTRRTSTRPSSRSSSTRTPPKCRSRRARDGVPEAWLEAAQISPGLQDGDGLEDRVSAASRIPHAADGVVRAAALADPVARRTPASIGEFGRSPGRAQPAHPGALPREPAHRRRRGAGRRSRSSACSRCARSTASAHLERRDNAEAARAGRPARCAAVEDMYRYLAIANYEDRFVIPTTHREYAENAYRPARRVRVLASAIRCSDGESPRRASSAARWRARR